jgi:hypothetical protein
MERTLRNIAAFMAALLVAALFSIQGLAQGDEYVQLTFEVQTSGEVDADATFFALYGLPQSEFSAVQLRDPDGDGNYTGNAQWMVGGKQLVVVLVQGTGTVDSQFGVFPGEPVTTIKEWREPMDIREDTSFTASVKGTVTGDEQQEPDNQQDGDDLVTKTFELKLNGDVPQGETFYAAYAETDRERSEGTFLIFCGDAELMNSEPSDVDCVGDDTVYTQEIKVPAGTEIQFSFGRLSAGDDEGEVFHKGTEVINADMTNDAHYTFGKGTGAGDDKQGEVPGEMPDTGAGGLATGATIPVSTAVAAAALMLGACGTALRYR